MRNNNNAPIIFDVPSAFVVESIVGQGAYGAVCKASFNDEQIAIKKIPHYSKNEDAGRRVLREIEVLQNLQFCEQVVGCKLVFRPTSGEKDIYVVMDYISNDLSSIIKCSSLVLEENVIRYIACQLFLAIRALHKCRVLHRDISTRNILIDNNSQVFLCDFGLSRFFDPDEQLSLGVVTQWYRAPEIILDAEYNYPSDVWSVGVVLGELLLRHHLFPGKLNDSADQLNWIFCLVGSPSREVFQHGNSFGRASANAKKYALAFIERRPSASTLREKLFASPLFAGGGGAHAPGAAADTPLAIQLVEALLKFDPADRPSAHEALWHPWFDPLRDYIDEVVAVQDAEPTHEFTITQNMNLNELVARIEETVPVFSEDLLVEEGEEEVEGAT